MDDGDLGLGVGLFDVAFRNMPKLLPLIIEYGRSLIAAGQPERWLLLVAKLPGEISANGRIRLLEAQAAFAVSDFETVKIKSSLEI